MQWTRRKFLKTAVAGAPITAGAPSTFGSAWKKLGGTTAVPFGVRRPLRSMVGAATIGATEMACFYVRSDGILFGSGSNSSGIFGSSEQDRSRFSQLMSTSNVASIDARFYTTMFVDSAGRLFGAGKNAEGMLGDGSTLDRSSFVQALGISHATQVACGYRHAAVRTAEGKVYTSGQNAGTYRLGVGDTVYRSSFVLAVGISNAMAVSCGFSSSIALRSDGAVYVGGGSVSAGESANGTGVANATFAQAIGISNAIAIASGFKSHYALRSDGIPFAVGYNSAGQLGDGSTTDRSTFVAVTGVSQVIAISAGGAFFNVYALRSDGAVFAAGSNFYGQIGDGGTISRSTFVQAVGLSQIVAIAPGLALRADGRLFAVGWNSSGQLGDGTTTNRSSFIAVL